MEAAEQDGVIVERLDAVLVVKLNRPAKRNAVNRAVRHGLNEATKQLEEDPELRVGVLASSTPGIFCAGADLSDMARTLPTGEAADAPNAFRPRTWSENAGRKKPWIAAVSGPVLAGGLEMALACQMIVSTRTAIFGLPEVKRGILAGSGGSFRLARVLPQPVAMEMLLAGRTIDAERAYQLGLVNRVVDEKDLLAETLALAEAVASCAPLAVMEAFAVARAAHDLPEAGLWEMAREARRRLIVSEDAKEGVQAFLEKRAPVWRGR